MGSRASIKSLTLPTLCASCKVVWIEARRNVNNDKLPDLDGYIRFDRLIGRENTESPKHSPDSASSSCSTVFISYIGCVQLQ